jgi:hypothetical protein
MHICQALLKHQGAAAKNAGFIFGLIHSRVTCFKLEVFGQLLPDTEVVATRIRDSADHTSISFPQRKFPPTVQGFHSNLLGMLA